MPAGYRLVSYVGATGFTTSGNSRRRPRHRRSRHPRPEIQFRHRHPARLERDASAHCRCGRKAARMPAWRCRPSNCWRPCSIPAPSIVRVRITGTISTRWRRSPRSTTGRDVHIAKPAEPWFFLKTAAGSIIGDGTPARLPNFSKQVDWEAEIAVIIGKPDAQHFRRRTRCRGRRLSDRQRSVRPRPDEARRLDLRL